MLNHINKALIQWILIQMYKGLFIVSVLRFLQEEFGLLIVGWLAL